MGDGLLFAAKAGAPVGTRTPNQLIKSQLLYQLSYRGKMVKVPNLLQYASTGTFYGRVKVDGKLYRDRKFIFIMVGQLPHKT